MIVYVNWELHKVCNEEELQDNINSLAEDYVNDDERFADFLDGRFTTVEVWNLDNEERENIFGDFKDECYFEAGCSIERDWEAIFVED